MKTIMKWTLLILSVATICTAGVSCRELASPLVQSEWPQIVRAARERVLEQSGTLDTPSKEMIQTNEPHLLVVHMPFANNYQFVWAIASNRTVELDAFSDYRNLNDKPVRIRESPKARQ